MTPQVHTAQALLTTAQSVETLHKLEDQLVAQRAIVTRNVRHVLSFKDDRNRRTIRPGELARLLGVHVPWVTARYKAMGWRKV